jgi:hypothetical protein
MYVILCYVNRSACFFLLALRLFLPMRMCGWVSGERMTAYAWYTKCTDYLHVYTITLTPNIYFPISCLFTYLSPILYLFFSF